MLNKSQIRRNLKGMSRRMLKGSWGLAIAVLLVPLAVSLSFTLLLYASATVMGIDPKAVVLQGYFLAPTAQLKAYSQLSSLSSFLQHLLTIPIGFGITAWFISLTDGERGPFSTVFCWMDTLSRFGKTLLLTFLLVLRTIGWALLIVVLPLVAFFVYFAPVFMRFVEGLPPAVLAPWVEEFAQNSNLPQGLNYAFEDLIPYLENTPAILGILLGGFLLFFVLAFLLYVWMLRYLPLDYLANRNPEASCGELFKNSVHMMKGHRFEAMWFHLSFLGWFLLASAVSGFLAASVSFLSGVPLHVLNLLLIPLPYLVLSAYFNTANVLFCEYIRDASRLDGGQAPYSVYRESQAPVPFELSDPGEEPPTQIDPPLS